MTPIARLTDSLPRLADGDGGVPRRILVPVDAFGLSERALALGARIGCAVGGEVRVLHIRVFDPPVRSTGRFYTESASHATSVLDQAVTAAWEVGCRASGITFDAQRAGIAQAISAAADGWHADLIILTRRRRRVIGMLLLGSVTHQVMRLAPCPVVAVSTSAHRAGPSQPMATDQP